MSSITPMTSNGRLAMRTVSPSGRPGAEQLAVDLAAEEDDAPPLLDVLIVDEAALPGRRSARISP